MVVQYEKPFAVFAVGKVGLVILLFLCVSPEATGCLGWVFSEGEGALAESLGLMGVCGSEPLERSDPHTPKGLL